MLPDDSAGGQGFSAYNAPGARASPPLSVLCSAAPLCRPCPCMLEQMRPWAAAIHHACGAHQQLCINQLLELQAMPLCACTAADSASLPAMQQCSRHCWKLT